VSDHIWQKKGLGSSPYAFDRFALGDAKCDACGHRIKRQFWVRSADGLTACVGSECIKRTEPHRWSQLRKDAEAAEKRFEEESAAKLTQKLEEWLAEDQHFLCDKPHPKWPMSTLRDYVQYVLVHGGAKKKLQVFYIAESEREKVVGMTALK
jgi:hypothetical protein